MAIRQDSHSLPILFKQLDISAAVTGEKYSNNNHPFQLKFSSWSFHSELPSILHYQCTQGAAPVSDASSCQTVNTGRLDYDDSPMPELEIFHKFETGIFNEASYDEEGVITDFNSLPTEIEENHKRLAECYSSGQLGFKPSRRTVYSSKLQQVMGFCNLPHDVGNIVAQGYTQEEGIDYDEVFAPVARIKAIRLFLAFASFMGFIVFQMDVKSAFLYGTIDEEVYVHNLHGLVIQIILQSMDTRRGTIDKTFIHTKDKTDINAVPRHISNESMGEPPTFFLMTSTNSSTATLPVLT
ncbi:putative ribonuclease H-like domain-containing protein [Tanacetum coccineum]|uniref:Ribonuclease H-like domain-containing protein n=1 Tax=Tanacetum coccineum TaxID=301880 RepID=A0ABQ5CLV6_9ASTR